MSDEFRRENIPTIARLRLEAQAAAIALTVVGLGTVLVMLLWRAR